MNIFFFFAGTILLGGNVIAAELRRNHVVGRAMKQKLPGLWNGKLPGIGFAVMVGNLGGGTVQEFDDRIVAEMKLVGALQVDDSGERDYPRDGPFVGGEADGKLASGGVSHHYDFLGVEIMLGRVLHEIVVGGADVGEGAGPASAIVAHAAVFEIGGGDAFCRQRGAEVAGMIEIVFGAPVAA